MSMTAAGLWILRLAAYLGVGDKHRRFQSAGGEKGGAPRLFRYLLVLPHDADDQETATRFRETIARTKHARLTSTMRPGTISCV